MKLGIIGAGRIASKMASTISRLSPEEGVFNYAIASRELSRAKEFASKYAIPKAYGSYKELVDDPEVDLVYIATPHSHHYPCAMLSLEAGKPVLCEKSFMANAREAEAVLDFAHKRGIFITEAMWTRFLPLSLKVRELLDSGIIGEPRVLRASLCYQMETKERVVRPDLCGGALLDVGVYCLSFARMYFGGDIASCSSSCVKFPSGVDMHDTISLVYRDGRIASLLTSAASLTDRQGIIGGSEGYIVVENVTNPSQVTIYKDFLPVETFYPPKSQVTGYEYQVLASRDAIGKGLLETPFMPHEETLATMRQMDELRRQWGIVYPMD